ncbi:hypothetical protein C8F04DRAFT_1183830 [Mycena alexandri]|uniref:Uncharacterized protein n=1 Tax=Mycena alexandri TaxID=1745969 RepID=A0AAD6X334_9AGAR|nr:hypothetical protein C8F04DRAFT_1183830 [Mycena alexandri]
MVLEFLDREIRADTKEKDVAGLEVVLDKSVELNRPLRPSQTLRKRPSSTVKSAPTRKKRTWPDLRLFSIKALNSIVLAALSKRFVNGREITTEMVLEFLDREIRADTKEKDEAGLQVVLSKQGYKRKRSARSRGLHINYEARPLKAEIVAVSTNCLGDAANYPWLEYTYIVRRGGHYFLPSCSRSGFHYLPDLAGE